MTAREVITLNESTPQLEAPQSGDTYSMPRDLQMYQATNDANPQIRIGSADANEGHIQAVYDSGAQTLDYLEIKTDSGGEGDIVLSPSGNVGIGTTSPSEKLHLGGNFQITSNTNDFVKFDRTEAANVETIFSFQVAGGAIDRFEIRKNAAGTELLAVDENGNVGIGTTTAGGGSTTGTKSLSIANGTAPSGGVANQVSLYSADVSNSAELFGLDEAGNTPQLTPHPADKLDGMPVEASGPYAYPWMYAASNPYLGKRITVDMAGVVKAVEALSGHSFTTIEDIDSIDWDAGQDMQAQKRQQAIEAAEAAKAAAETQEEADAIVVPEPYAKKAPPKWMKDRGVRSSL